MPRRTARDCDCVIMHVLALLVVGMKERKRPGITVVDDCHGDRGNTAKFDCWNRGSVVSNVGERHIKPLVGVFVDKIVVDANRDRFLPLLVFECEHAATTLVIWLLVHARQGWVEGSREIIDQPLISGTSRAVARCPVHGKCATSVPNTGNCQHDRLVGPFVDLRSAHGELQHPRVAIV